LLDSLDSLDSRHCPERSETLNDLAHPNGLFDGYRTAETRREGSKLSFQPSLAL